jgi:hypothetical protein
MSNDEGMTNYEWGSASSKTNLIDGRMARGPSGVLDALASATVKLAFSIWTSFGIRHSCFVIHLRLLSLQGALF